MRSVNIRCQANVDGSMKPRITIICHMQTVFRVRCLQKDSSGRGGVTLTKCPTLAVPPYAKPVVLEGTPTLGEVEGRGCSMEEEAGNYPYSMNRLG